MTVEPYFGTLACTFELDEDMFALPLGRSGEEFRVTACIIGQVVDIDAVCPVFVPRTRKCDRSCLVRILNGFGWVVELPVAVEVEFLSLRRHGLCEQE